MRSKQRKQKIKNKKIISHNALFHVVSKGLNLEHEKILRKMI